MATSLFTCELSGNQKLMRSQFTPHRPDLWEGRALPELIRGRSAGNDHISHLDFPLYRQHWFKHALANILLSTKEHLSATIWQALTLWLFKWDKSPVVNITMDTFHYGLLIDSTTCTPCRHIYTMVYINAVTQQNINTFLKRQFTQHKMKMLSSFTHTHVVPNLCDFLLWRHVHVWLFFGMQLQWMRTGAFKLRK